MDYTLARPLNPEALVGQTVAKKFGTRPYEGKITKFKKWWTVEYTDGDVEDLNYRQLVNLERPPTVDMLKYPNPDAACAEFMKKSNGKTEMKAVQQKGCKPIDFRMEQRTWTLISIFLVKDSKRPLHGAYVDEDDFCHAMRDMPLYELKTKYPEVRVSAMDDIRRWIEVTETETVRNRT